MLHFTRQQDYTLEESSLLEGEGAGVSKDGLRRVRWFSSGKKVSRECGQAERAKRIHLCHSMPISMSRYVCVGAAE